MIVKKMPILQGFPDIETVKILSKAESEFSEFCPIFYDIETTGLARSSTFLYLIGAVVREAGVWQLYQWFAESPEDEPVLLRTFAEFLEPHTLAIQYNGNRFDQPYLEARYAHHQLASPFDGLSSLDLYQQLKNCQPLFRLSRMRQPDLEVFSRLPSRTFCDGEECIRLYRSYRKAPDTSLLDVLLGHNREDLIGLGKIFPLLSYLNLYQGNYFSQNAVLREQQCILTLSLPFPVPVPLSNGNEEFHLFAENSEVQLSLPLREGKLRQYYSNYRDYDYLPAEDTAIPKSLSAYMDKKLRIPAKPDTCYTWFFCDDPFLTSPQKQMQYLRHSLLHLLGSLKNQDKTDRSASDSCIP